MMRPRGRGNGYRGRGLSPHASGMGNRRPTNPPFLSGGQINLQRMPLITPSLQQQQDEPYPPPLMATPIDDAMEIIKPEERHSSSMHSDFFSRDNLIPLSNFKEEVDAAMESATGDNSEDMLLDTDDQPKDKKVVNIRTKRQRVNKILNKVKPKSSMAILNEIYKDVTYDVSQVENNYKADVKVNDKIFTGFGRNKALAQTAAAEEALKSIILSNNELGTAQDVDDQTPGHSHLLSYALYKLLTSWDESGSMVNKMQQSTGLKSMGTMKPTKKFPENPEKIHPVMLFSQTNPNAKFKEVGSTPPPNSSFTIECMVEDKIFLGTGKTKKEAKKQAAMKACQDLLGVKYSEADV